MNGKNLQSIYHASVNVNLMVENQTRSEIMINVGTNVEASYIWKRLYLKSCYMQLEKWLVCSKCYWQFSDYLWWHYRRGRNKNYSKKYDLWKKSFCILLAFLLITIALLIAFSNYFCLIKHKSKQKHLLHHK